MIGSIYVAIIIAHAITERMPLVSSDHKFDFCKKSGARAYLQ